MKIVITAEVPDEQRDPVHRTMMTAKAYDLLLAALAALGLDDVDIRAAEPGGS